MDDKSGGQGGGGLRRQLGLADALALFVGVILGSGIFFAPGAVAAVAPGAWGALPWLAGAAVAGCGALCYAECGARLPRAGGFFEFYREAHGEGLAFVAGWAAVLVTYPASAAAIAHVLAAYLGRLVPGAAAHPAAVACAAIAAAGLLNAVGVRVGALAQRALSAAKVIALLVLVVAALVGAAADRSPALASPPVDAAAPALPALAAVLGALAVVLWTYDGWSDVTLIAGELRDPARHLGRTVLVGLSVLAALYVLVQVAVGVLLPPEAAASSDGVVAAAVAAGLGPRAGGLVAALVVVSTFGAINGVVLAAPRVGYAMARAGVLPRAFGAVRPGSGTPARSVIGLTLACLAYALWSDLIGLISLFTFAVWIFYALTAVALIRLRRRGVGEPLAWRAPGGWLPPTVVVATAALMTASQVASDWKRAGLGAALLLLAVPAWLVLREWREVKGGG